MAIKAFLEDNRTDGAFPVDLEVNESNGKARLVIGRKGIALMTLNVSTRDLTDGLMQAVVKKE